LVCWTPRLILWPGGLILDQAYFTVSGDTTFYLDNLNFVNNIFFLPPNDLLYLHLAKLTTTLGTGRVGAWFWDYNLVYVPDTTQDLFYWCEAYLYLQAFTDKRGNDRNQRREIKERLAEQIQMIQTGLRFALNVTIKTPAEKLG